MFPTVEENYLCLLSKAVYIDNVTGASCFFVSVGEKHGALLVSCLRRLNKNNEYGCNKTCCCVVRF